MARRGRNPATAWSRGAWAMSRCRAATATGDGAAPARRTQACSASGGAAAASTVARRSTLPIAAVLAPPDDNRVSLPPGRHGSGCTTRMKTAALIFFALLAACGGEEDAPAPPDPEPLPPPSPGPTHVFDPIETFVVIYPENRGFDHLFGEYPGADGVAQGRLAAPQVDDTGVPYPTLPRPRDTSAYPAIPDLRFPDDLPNAPFPLQDFVDAATVLPDLVHRFYQQQRQINRGRMDHFVEV